MTACFEVFKTYFPRALAQQNIPKGLMASNALASMTEQSATTFVNNIVEPSASRARCYFFAKLQFRIPVRAQIRVGVWSKS